MTNSANCTFTEKSRFMILLIAFFLPFIWFCTVRMICNQAGENSNDAYYHAAMAERGPSAFCAKTFPQLELSIWRDNFADKELLYHSCLCGIFKVEGFFGIKIHAPFHFAALIFMALALAAFLFVLQRLDISPLLWIPSSLLFGMIAPNVLFRFQMLRPHVLSLALLLLLTGLLLRGKLKYRLVWTLIISIIYTWSYSNPQFVLFPVSIFALAGWKREGAKSLLLILSAFFGILLGLTLHPQFPNTFYIWKVQSWDAILGPILTNSMNHGRSLLPPLEMGQPDVLYFRDCFPLWIFAYFTFLIFARLITAKGWKGIAPEYYALALLSLAYLGGTFIVLRTIEYSAPFTVLFGTLVTDLALKEKIFLPGREHPMRFCTIFTIAAIVISFYSSVMASTHVDKNTPPATQIGKWMEEHLPEKAIVVNMNWGDFPSLFHANHKQVILWGMDPVFSFAKDAEKAQKIEEMLLKPEYLSPRLFYQLTGTRYAFVLARREKFIRYLKSLGWHVLYEEPDGAVFYVE